VSYLSKIIAQVERRKNVCVQTIFLLLAQILLQGCCKYVVGEEEGIFFSRFFFF